MPKAILELEMPKSCRNCEFAGITNICHVLSERNRRKGTTAIDKILAYTPSEGRRPDCPLRLMEEKKGCDLCMPKNTMRSMGVYGRKFSYCPCCGRKLEVE